MRLTPRGWVMAVTSVALVAVGTWTAAIDLVRFGALLAVVVLAGVGWVLWPAGRRSGPVRRVVDPDPVHAGQATQVLVRAPGLADLHAPVVERAAPALTGGTVRPVASREGGELRLAYTLHPSSRGRWDLGPLLLARTDPLAVARRRIPVGAVTPVTVWPSVTPLPPPDDVTLGEAGHVALAVHGPAVDDASLRDYRQGDDLRRVHWASSARRGRLVVRADESAGMRPVTVLIDRPVQPSELEWTLGVAASIAIAALDGGHPVRIAGPGMASTGFVSRGGGARARAELLDAAVDLTPAPADADPVPALEAACAQVVATTGQAVLAVLGPVAGPAGARLARVAEVARARAVVHGVAADDVLALRLAGWVIAEVEVGDDPRRCWDALTRAPR